MNAKRRVLWGALFAVLLGVIAWIGLAEADAEAKARAFCGRFPVGSGMADVAAAAADTGDGRHRFVREKEVSVAFIGLPPFSRHVCIFDGKAGKVTQARYLHLD